RACFPCFTTGNIFGIIGRKPAHGTACSVEISKFWLTQLIKITAEQLPLPKEKRKKLATN
ncbi:MAG: hypothetical protein ACK4PR_05260, partial [Gammaproteobacteria bacterium]